MLGASALSISHATLVAVLLVLVGIAIALTVAAGLLGSLSPRSRAAP